MTVRFLGQPHTTLRRKTVMSAIGMLDRHEANTLLKSILPERFIQVVEDHGISLVECIREAKSHLDRVGPDAEPILTNLELARFIASTAGDQDLLQVLIRLQSLLKERGRFAVNILHACEEQFGRDGMDGKGPILVPDSLDAIECY